MSSEDSTTTVYRFDGRPFEAAPECPPFDFSNPYRLNKEDEDTLSKHMLQGAKAAAGRLALMLRLDYKVALKGLRTQSYQEYLKTLQEPACLGVFSAQGLQGLGLLMLPMDLGLHFVNRLLGGKGLFDSPQRVLSSIEKVVLEDPLKLLLEEWGQQWQPLGLWPAQLLGLEHHAQFLSLSDKNSGFLVTDIELTLNETSKTLQWAVPYSMIDPVLKKLYTLRKHYQALGTAKPEYHWTTSYESIKVPVAARWHTPNMTLRSFLDLKPGSLIRLPTEQLEQTELSIKGTPRFLGQVGLEGKQVAIQLTQTL